MIILKMLLIAQTYHAQCPCDSLFSWGEDCTYQQCFCLFPNPFREQPRKGFKDRDIFCMQGRHRLSLGGVFAFNLPCFFVNALMDKVQLSVYDVQEGKVMLQVEVGRKENEISKAHEALKPVNILGKVLTGDAMHTQKRLSTQILEGQGDFVFPVKENQEKLYKNIQSLFAPEYPKSGFGKIQTDFQSAQKVNKGHGRLEVRTIQTSEMLNSYSGWLGLAQVYRLDREIQWWRAGKCYRTSSEVEFGITSLSCKTTSPLQLLEIRRVHWGIETGYRRDVTLKEDATRMTVGSTGFIMASINNLTLALIRQAKFCDTAQARRWFASNLSRAFILLTTLLCYFEKAMLVGSTWVN